MEGNSDYSIPSDEEDVKVKVKNDRKMSKESKVQTLSVDFDAILPHIGKNLINLLQNISFIHKQALTNATKYFQVKWEDIN